MSSVARLTLPLCFASLAGTTTGLCADLSILPQVAGRGASVPVAITFASHGETVCGIQFDLVVDDSALSLSTVVGEAARGSGKTLYVAQQEPGRTRILITELNQSPTSDGAIVDLFANIAENAVPGSYSIHLQSAIASDAFGKPMAVTMSDGSITVTPTYGNPCRFKPC